jgi:hypothetical protein
MPEGTLSRHRLINKLRRKGTFESGTEDLRVASLAPRERRGQIGEASAKPASR